MDTEEGRNRTANALPGTVETARNDVTGRRHDDGGTAEAAVGTRHSPTDEEHHKGSGRVRRKTLTTSDDVTTEFENPIEEQLGKYSRLLPAEFFDERFRDTEPDENRARHSPTVQRRFASSCAGWPSPHPTSEELYDALRAERPTKRQEAVIDVWADEATEEEVVQAWVENVYSWGMLARACRRSGRLRRPIHLILNIHSRWTGAEPPERTWPT